MTMSSPLSLPILILGAGAWGTAMAAHWAARSTPGAIRLWGRDAGLMRVIDKTRQNEKYLPGFALPEALQIETDLSQACANWRSAVRAYRSTDGASQPVQGLIVLAVPMAGLSQTAREAYQFLGQPQNGEGVLWLAKGLKLVRESGRGEVTGLQWPHEIVSENMPGWPCGACSGPSFAQEVAASLPVALSVASPDLNWARAVAHACHGAGMRLYATADLIGVELGGAMKNVLAIAAGVCDGLALGANARAALLTRGLAEMARLGVAIGAQEKTFLGLATLGDLILTATGDLSRNRRVGLALARGEKLEQIVRALGHVAEGVATAPAMLALAQQRQVEVPITEAVCLLLEGKLTAPEAIHSLMSREPRDEHIG